MSGEPSNRFSFSIRTLLLATSASGVLLGGLFNPNDVSVYGVAAMLVMSVIFAWYTCVRDWPSCNVWMLAFAIAATQFWLDPELVPFEWQDAAFAFVHPEDAAEHANSPASGLNKEALDFKAILNDSVVFAAAVVSATVIMAVRPTRLPSSLIFGLLVTTSAGLLFINNGVAFAISLTSGGVLTAVWFVILRDLHTKHLLTTEFAVSTTCFKLFVCDRVWAGLPDLGLEEMLHGATIARRDAWIFLTMYSDCFALWIGGIVGVVVWLVAKSQS